MDEISRSEIILDFDHFPIVPVKFKYKDKKTPIIESLLDSGGDFIVLPYPIASFLDLELEPACDIDTAGGTTSLYKTKVDMAIGRKDKCNIYRNQEIHVSNREDIPVLLGRTPIFEDYEITFKKKKNQLILQPLTLEIQNKYPDDF